MTIPCVFTCCIHIFKCACLYTPPTTTSLPTTTILPTTNKLPKLPGSCPYFVKRPLTVLGKSNQFFICDTMGRCSHSVQNPSLCFVVYSSSSPDVWGHVLSVVGTPVPTTAININVLIIQLKHCMFTLVYT